MVNAYEVNDQFGSGGGYLSPDGGSGAPDLKTLLRSIRSGIWVPLADQTAMEATEADNRGAGQLTVKVDDMTIWVWSASSTASAGAEVIVPTDVGVGAGRFLRVTSPAAGVSPTIQAGTGTLVAGELVVATATITASSVILVGRKAALGAAVGTGFDTGTRTPGAPGSFTILSIDSAKATVAADVSTVDWLVIG